MNARTRVFAAARWRIISLTLIAILSTGPLMQNEKERVALTSIAVSAGLTVAKAAVGLISGSLALLSEAAHSAIDCFATIMTYFAVRISGKPADEKHHYGHGKVESITALAETALLFVLSGVVIWEAVSVSVSMVRRPSRQPARQTNTATTSAATESPQG
jgi:cation diffusion facilitator family transporter